MPEDSSPSSHPFTRRDFLAHAGRGLVAATLAGELLPAAAARAAGPDDQKPIKLPEIHDKTEQEAGPVPAPLPPGERVGIAVVGLGHLALNQILPGLVTCKKTRLAALVSGSKDKGREVARQYGLAEKYVYDYKTYDDLRDNPDVEIIYIVLPNGLHAEYTVRGAEAGKHVLCEKPMANSSAECRQMIDACKKADRKLMIAYRIQYEPHNRLALNWTRTKKYGAAKIIESINTQNDSPNQWRQNKALAGGGCLPDVGLYCLNTTRFLLGEEPTEVSAMIYSTPGDPRFKEVEESVVFQMRFPSGVLANCATSYGAHECRRYRVNAEAGWFGLDAAFAYQNLRIETDHAEGMIDEESHPGIMPKDQFALEMDHMAECVRNHQTPYTPGEEGLQDQRIMEAIYESASAGKPVKITTPGAEEGKLDLFRGTEPKAAA